MFIKTRFRGSIRLKQRTTGREHLDPTYFRSFQRNIMLKILGRRDIMGKNNVVLEKKM